MLSPVKIGLPGHKCHSTEFQTLSRQANYVMNRLLIFFCCFPQKIATNADFRSYLRSLDKPFFLKPLINFIYEQTRIN